MSSKTRILAFAVAFAMIAGFGFAAQADVTGSFTTHIAVDLPTQTDTNATGSQLTEEEVLTFDIQNEINIAVVISGLSTKLHSHFGIAGVEDVALTYAATLGALDINGQFVFGRFGANCLAINENCVSITNNPVPQQDDLRFIKKRVKTSISLGGVSFTNLAMFEDVTLNGPVVQNVVPGVDQVFGGQASGANGSPTWHQTPQYGFGDVITLSGQTPSGVSIRARTGICAGPHPNVIKKHSWPFRVNPECAGVSFGAQSTNLASITKPELLFDFETLNISGIPVASGVTANADIQCVRISKCSMVHTFNFTGMTPIPLSASFQFDDLFTLSFAGATLEFSTGAGTLTTQFDSTGQLGAVEVDLSTTLNPDTNPANFSINAALVPGQGIDFADVALGVSRSNVNFNINANFGSADGSGSTSVDFQGVEFSVGTTVGSVDVSTSANFGAFGFNSWESSFTISF